MKCRTMSKMVDSRHRLKPPSSQGPSCEYENYFWCDCEKFLIPKIEERRTHECNRDGIACNIPQIRYVWMGISHIHMNKKNHQREEIGSDTMCSHFEIGCCGRLYILWACIVTKKTQWHWENTQAWVGQERSLLTKKTCMAGSRSKISVRIDFGMIGAPLVWLIASGSGCRPVSPWLSQWGWLAREAGMIRCRQLQ